MAKCFTYDGSRMAENRRRNPYNVLNEPPDGVRLQLKRFGANVEQLEADDKLRITDFYSASLGQKTKEKYGFDSLKVAELSIEISQILRETQPLRPDSARIVDNISVLARFNEEKLWVEFFLNRVVPVASASKTTSIIGLVRDLHSNWVYKNLETACDGVVDSSLRKPTKWVNKLQQSCASGP